MEEEEGKRMKVLFVAYQDFASVAYHLSRALRGKGIDADVVTELPQRWGLLNDHVVQNGFSKEAYKSLLAEADVIVSSSGYFDYRPFGLPFPDKAKLALWNGGTNYRQNHEFYNNKVLPRYDICYAHWDLAPLSALNHVLNQPIDTNKFKYMTRRPFAKTMIGHIPSSDQKGTNIFLEAIEKLKKEFPPDPVKGDRFGYECLGNIDHGQVMLAKRRYHIYFDQILDQFIPSPARRPYGLALVESACYGSLCMAGVDADETCPIQNVMSVQDIVDVCTPVIEGDFEYWDMVSRDTRRWVVINHSYEACADQFLRPLKGKV
jgi:hypothetical protein